MSEGFVSDNNMPAKKEQPGIVIYQTADKRVNLEVSLDQETLWLSQKQMATLFSVGVNTINYHVKDVFRKRELSPGATIRKFRIVQKEGSRRIWREIDLYNLDMVISVGYRINSIRGTQFRIWATKVLKQHLLHGYTLNRRRLQQRDLKLSELQRAVGLFQQVMARKQLSQSETDGLLRVITDYTKTWVWLQRYDEGKLPLLKTGRVIARLDYDRAETQIAQLKKQLLKKRAASDLFGRERENGLDGILKNLEQTFGGKALYPTVAERAAHLLYFVIKDHPFVDGNKRIASFLFLEFLRQNRGLFTKKGERKFSDNALVALALLIAQSPPREKDVMVKLISNFLAG